MNAVWSLTAATVTFVLVDFVDLVRELILEVLSEFVLAAPPPVLCQQKHPQTTPKNRTSLLASLTLCEMDVHLGRPDSV